MTMHQGATQVPPSTISTLSDGFFYGDDNAVILDPLLNQPHVLDILLIAVALAIEVLLIFPAALRRSFGRSVPD